MLCISILTQGYSILSILAYAFSMLACGPSILTWGRSIYTLCMASFLNIWHMILLILLFDPFGISIAMTARKSISLPKVIKLFD